MMQRKVVICGSAGQLGVELRREFHARGWMVAAFDRSQLDITDAADVDEAISSSMPNCVINSAAYNQVDIAEKEPLAAYQVNALGVRNLALACRSAGAKFIHYSTDYVFDGTKGSSYLESDAPHPLGAYGVSKLAGEFYAQAYLDNALILRTCGVFGPGGMFTPRANFVEVMLRLAKENKPIRVVQDNIVSPAYAPAMAARTADMLERELFGVYHLGGGEPISWYAYARMIFDAAGLSPSLTAIDTSQYKTAARRPTFSALSNEKLNQAGVRPMPPLRRAVEDYFAARKDAKAHR